MKLLKNLINKINYKIYLKNKGIIYTFINKTNIYFNKALKVILLKDYNSHFLWKTQFKSNNQTSMSANLIKFQKQYFKNK